MIELKSPVAVVWEICDVCNFKCPHCRAYLEKHSDNSFLENLIIRNIIDFGILSVNLSGGEPLLNPRINCIVKTLNDSGVDVGISTNGWFFKEKAEGLVKSGISFVQISLDGPKGIHDKFRGVEGAFEHAVDSMKYAKELGLFVQMNVTLTAYNLFETERMVELAKKIGADKVFFRRVVPAGLANTNNDVFPAKKDYLFVVKKLVEMQNSNSDSIYIAIDDPIVSAIREDSESALCCSAGITSLGINSNGDVFPCIFLRKKIGNILENDISDIWNNSTVLKKLRKRDIEECGICKFKFSCGGCRAFSGLFSKDKMCPLEKTQL